MFDKWIPSCGMTGQDYCKVRVRYFFPYTQDYACSFRCAKVMHVSGPCIKLTWLDKKRLGITGFILHVICQGIYEYIHPFPDLKAGRKRWKSSRNVKV